MCVCVCRCETKSVKLSFAANTTEINGKTIFALIALLPNFCRRHMRDLRIRSHTQQPPTSQIEQIPDTMTEIICMPKKIISQSSHT